MGHYLQSNDFARSSPRFSSVPPTRDGRLLIDAAVQNFSSWQIEPKNIEEIVEISYEYAIDNAVNHDTLDVKLQLPTQIVIRRGP